MIIVINLQKNRKILIKFFAIQICLVTIHILYRQIIQAMLIILFISFCQL